MDIDLVGGNGWKIPGILKIFFFNIWRLFYYYVLYALSTTTVVVLCVRLSRVA